MKESEPEGIVLIHVEHTRQTDHAAPGCGFRQRFVLEQALQFIGIEIGQRVFCLDLADAPFAAIAGMERLAVGKPLGADQALVAARFAAVAAALRRESFKRRGSDQRTLIAVYSPVAGNQGRAERSHQSGDIRPDHRTPQNLFGGSQYRIVVKRSALHYYGVAEFGGVF